MTNTFKWVCWLPAWMLLCFCIASVEGIGVSSSTPPTNSSAPMGLHGYRRYFANDTLIGHPVPCTRDDKICFRHNLVFDPAEERCKPLESLRHYCGIKEHEEELERDDEHVVNCLWCKDTCSGYRMAYDGICYEKEIVNDVICGRDANITRHPSGNFECREAPATPISIKQPEENGSCVIPDLRFPDTARRVFYNNPLTPIEQRKSESRLQCGAEQIECFFKNKVFVAGYDGCHSLLKQGPCAENHVVALDLQAATQGRAEGTCVHKRGGCPKGHKRMLFDGQCHEDREVEIEAPGEIIFNQFGKYIVSDDDYVEFGPKLINNTCAINAHSVRVIIISSNIEDACEFSNEDKDFNRVVSEPPHPQF